MKVYIYRRPDESVYASTDDYGDFQIKPIRIVEVSDDFPDPTTHPDVLAAIKAFQEADWMEPNWI